MIEQRRDFLRKACAPVVMTVLGIPMIEACSTEEVEDSAMGATPFTPSEPLILNISEGDLSVLKTVGGWINYTAKDLLMVRIDQATIRVFNNRCPHQGARDQWTFDGSSFTCTNHNNSYENSCSGQLQCYNASLDGDVLTITP